MAERWKPESPDPSADVFSAGGGKRKPGRPPIHDEQWTKVTVVLFDRQIVFLDGISASIRSRNGASISRAQLIRAFVDAIGQTEIDITAVTAK